jgi:protein PET117
MHAGVERDLENQRIKRERQADFEMQKQMEAEYKKIQTVSQTPVSEALGKGKGVSTAA